MRLAQWLLLMANPLVAQLSSRAGLKGSFDHGLIEFRNGRGKFIPWQAGCIGKPRHRISHHGFQKMVGMNRPAALASTMANAVCSGCAAIRRPQMAYRFGQKSSPSS